MCHVFSKGLQRMLATGHAGRDGFECCTIQSVDNLEMTELRLMPMWPFVLDDSLSCFLKQNSVIP